MDGESRLGEIVLGLAHSLEQVKYPGKGNGKTSRGNDISFLKQHVESRYNTWGCKMMLRKRSCQKTGRFGWGFRWGWRFQELHPGRGVGRQGKELGGFPPYGRRYQKGH